MLGIVDNIAPRDTLEKVELNIAQRFACKPSKRKREQVNYV